MKELDLLIKKKMRILALGAESAGVFAVYKNGSVFVSESFGDLLDENNFLKYKKAVLGYLRKEKLRPDIILIDLHPLYKTTVLGEELARKFKAKRIKVQHHVAHIFSSVGDKLMSDKKYLMPDTFAGIAMDGTGYGLDENIWGGEVFRFSLKNKKQSMERIGSLEEQVMIGGDLAVREPARMLISILTKFLPEETAYEYIKKYYSKNEFKALASQMRQDFNCQRTTSTGRILDAAAVLLGFSGNERKFKHEAVKKLEENSGVPYGNLKPKINGQESREILDTTYLFEYLIKNIDKDKNRLAATAQLYIAKGLLEIIKNHDSKFMSARCSLGAGGVHDLHFAAGGMANNKIISAYLGYHNVFLAKKIPRGDEGIAVGQIIYCLL